ncbi:hypothetical protein D3879_25155 [Pseudomonas cavernicola]|uniref:Uncharacterized protein n=1 Tax=Pseudomonas cavernicola TaxID=2320866 RepID=A0A418X9D5_9PSED|nr:hypothetical protein [Pseudomonas cavernicola]RJG09096.1 hypothetical protein D3879_25155 [Pseudomonas cavernicola]
MDRIYLAGAIHGPGKVPTLPFSDKILTCYGIGVTVFVPKMVTSGTKVAAGSAGMTAPDLTFFKRCEQAEAASVLAFALLELCPEGTLHTRFTAPSQLLGA